MSIKITFWSCHMFTLSTRVLRPFMNCSFMLIKITFRNCHMFTLPTRVCHPFMNCSFMETKITLGSCHMLTVPARVLHPFMNCSSVLNKTSLCGCLIVTLPARKLYAFKNCSFVSRKMTFWSYPIVTLPAREFCPFMNCFFVFSKITLSSSRHIYHKGILPPHELFVYEEWVYSDLRPCTLNMCIHAFLPHLLCLDSSREPTLRRFAHHKRYKYVQVFHSLGVEEHSSFAKLSLNFNFIFGWG